jgi:tRNA threonylcarbamoyladenosine biosynthesis protein TsaB
MLVLALETSGITSGVAVVREGEPLGEVTLASRETHSRTLIKTIEWLLERLGKGWPDIGLVAVSIGPGSFTGLRIGLATGKGLAFALGIPLIGVPTLDALAGHVTPGEGDLVCPVLDARKAQVYAAFFRGCGAGSIERIGPYMVVSPQDLIASLPACRRVFFLGDAICVYGEIFSRCPGGRAVLVPGHLSHVRAVSVGLWAETNVGKKETPDDLRTLKPLYVRPSI